MDGKEHSVTLKWLQETFQNAQNTKIQGSPATLIETLRGSANPACYSFTPGEMQRIQSSPHFKPVSDPWFEDLGSAIGPLEKFFGTLSREDILKWAVAQKSSFVVSAVAMYLHARDIIIGAGMSPQEMQKQGFVNSHVVPPEKFPGFDGFGYLESLHNKGWTVAVHNDYRMDGEMYTFWLFTHLDGRYVKGEGKTEHEALKQAYEAATPDGEQ
jgi:hypothetical protein